MTRVIKAGDHSRARVIGRFDKSDVDLLNGIDPTTRFVNPDSAEVVELRGLLELARAEIESLKDDVRTAGEAGLAAGRQAMKREIEQSREKALTLLEAGIRDANAEFAALRDRAETIGLLVGQTALEKLLGADETRATTISELVRHQIQQIDRQSILEVQVSRIDFPDVQEVTALAERIGVDRLLLSTAEELVAGACRIKLRLGTLDVGLDRQWGEVRALLESLAGIPRRVT